MKTLGRVNGIISNIVIAKVDGAVAQNEICYVYCGETRMMAEVLNSMLFCMHLLQRMIQNLNTVCGKIPKRVRNDNSFWTALFL